MVRGFSFNEQPLILLTTTKVTVKYLSEHLGFKFFTHNNAVFVFLSVGIGR